MKRSTPWNSTFSDRLTQSQDAKNARLKKIAGYDLYILYIPRKKEIPVKQVAHSFSYSMHTTFIYGRLGKNTKVRWLKPKHVTLLRMQGVEVMSYQGGSGFRAKQGYSLDIESY
jgi:hypothetical protein